MDLVIVSFLAGALTVLSPCILPLLPVTVGGAAGRSTKSSLVIIASLALSVFVFSLLLKGSTLLLGVPSFVWSLVSGILIVVVGILFIWPSNKYVDWFGPKETDKGLRRDILIGASLGPAFNSCSPTYALIVAVILPVAFAKGLLYLGFYTLALSLVLLFITLFGQAVIEKVAFTQTRRFRVALGIIFVAVGTLLILGVDKDLQTWIIENGWYDPVKNLENGLR